MSIGCKRQRQQQPEAQPDLPQGERREAEAMGAAFASGVLRFVLGMVWRFFAGILVFIAILHVARCAGWAD